MGNIYILLYWLHKDWINYIRLNWRTLKSWCHINQLCHKEPKRTPGENWHLLSTCSLTSVKERECLKSTVAGTCWQDDNCEETIHTLLLSFTFGLTKTELSPQPIWHKICLFYQWIRDKPQTNLTVNFMLTLHLDKITVSWFFLCIFYSPLNSTIELLVSCQSPLASSPGD